MDFDKFRILTEASGKNLHLEHLEDEVLNGGVVGTRGAINFLRALRDMLGGSSSSSTIITTKWDGAPAVAAGIDPATGQFFVSYKSMKKLAFTEQDVKDNYEGALYPIYSALMEHLPKLKIKGNVYQGDVLWTNDSQKKEKTIDGEKYLTFTPNTITYAIPADSELAATINKAKVGIVFHTTYPTSGADTVDDLTAEFGADTSSFSKSNDVWAIDAEFSDVSGSATFTSRDTAKITVMLSAIGSLFNKIDGRFLDSIATDNKLKIHIKAYINSKIRTGSHITNPQRDVKGLLDYVKGKLEAEVGKLKSEKGRERKQIAADAYIKKLSGNDKQLENVFKIMALINNVKLYIVEKLETVKGMTSTFVRDGDGYKVTKPEGFVAIDKFDKGKGLKLVNRLEFSRANFNVDKNWDQ